MATSFALELDTLTKVVDHLLTFAPDKSRDASATIARICIRSIDELAREQSEAFTLLHNTGVVH